MMPCGVGKWDGVVLVYLHTGGKKGKGKKGTKSKIGQCGIHILKENVWKKIFTSL